MEQDETTGYQGIEIKIEQDSDATDPREDFDHVGTMVCFHSRYKLGDKHNYSGPKDALLSILKIDEDEDENGLSIDELFSKLYEIAYVLPLYLYDHSGITMNTGGFACPWDSGQVGFIYAMKDYANSETPDPIKYLKGEVDEYDKFLTGDVWGYTCEDPEGYVDEDSCWGFFGHEHCLQEARLIAKQMAEEKTMLKIQEAIEGERESLKRYKTAYFPTIATTA